MVPELRDALIGFNPTFPCVYIVLSHIVTHIGSRDDGPIWCMVVLSCIVLHIGSNTMVPEMQHARGMLRHTQVATIYHMGPSSRMMRRLGSHIGSRRYGPILSQIGAHIVHET